MSSSAGSAGQTTPVIDPATEEWLAALAAAGAGGPALYELSPADARQVLRDEAHGLVSRRGDAGDRHPLALEQVARGREELAVVVDDDAPRAHALRMPTAVVADIAASGCSDPPPA